MHVILKAIHAGVGLDLGPRLSRKYVVMSWVRKENSIINPLQVAVQRTSNGQKSRTLPPLSGVATAVAKVHPLYNTWYVRPSCSRVFMFSVAVISSLVPQVYSRSSSNSSEVEEMKDGRNINCHLMITL